jgi:hypothetical protein
MLADLESKVRLRKLDVTATAFYEHQRFFVVYIVRLKRKRRLNVVFC